MRADNDREINDFYEFEDFRLDLREKELLKNGVKIPLPPKVFDTLSVFAENAGRLVEKEKLMNLIWTDSFVEESNITYTIRMLRKALGDDAASPRFVETVPRRGYRFIAEVRGSSSEHAGNNGSEQPNTEPLPLKRSSSSRALSLLAAVIVMIAGGIAVTGYWLTKTAYSNAPVLSAPFASEKVSTNGKVRNAVISRDGKSVFYTNGVEGQQSVWLRHLESSQSIEIIPPSDDFYYGLELSPDGNFLYFVRSDRQVRDTGLYRVSVFGGIPERILSGTEGWISISPDGGTVSFVRCPYTKEEYCSLWVADALNGTNEKKLTSRPQPIRIGDNKFSPDGRSIAFAVGQSQNQANDFGLEEINIETGEVSSLTSEKFFNIKNLAWLPNKDGLLITASRTPNKYFRIWEISAADAIARPLTNDSESYSRLSLDLEAGFLISTQVKQDFRLMLFSTDDPVRPSGLVEAMRATYFPNGKLAYSSAMSGNDEIWSINSDGTGQKQLTNNLADDIWPVVSPDNEYVFFSANRTGKSQVWRMKADGSDQTQLTMADGGYPFFVSPDGKWVFYHHGVDRTLWRVPAGGGNEELVLDKRAVNFAISPDGKNVAFSTWSEGGQKRSISIANIDSGKVFKTYTVEFSDTSSNDIVWMPDGNAFVYIVAAGPGNNTILLLQRTADQTPTKIADLGADSVNSFAVSPDGKSFAIVQGGWRHDAVLFRGLR
ncbi:MAG TPA: winged helix-turn-helix domain-containing protein [Pyrinomonadaceae bacterium]|nr:winged helix-turn-helix domain-containing protein [Pyrinomonadaceae bacterium]HMP66130.1 winged helix-turn-helix domain-containing protein [Pyrinomonadaceae bacterium]